MFDAKQKEELVEKIFAFHTKRAPAIPIGVEMVDLALDKLGPVKDKINAVCEGGSCLVDVLQIAVGCTYGNKYLRILDKLGRFAFTLYDRHDGRGIRVYLDYEKIDADKTPELAKFFLRKRSPEIKNGGPKRKASGQQIMNEFKSLDYSIFGWEAVKVPDHGKPPMFPAEICEGCNESFLATKEGQKKCLVCQGEIEYYQKA
jgi:formylmethanofuran dehydrogenase subunit E